MNGVPSAGWFRDGATKACLARLNGVAGFVTQLGLDPRVGVFARSGHIRRVMGVVRGRGPPSGDVLALRIAAVHELNRLPFAHLAEKPLGFDQAADFPAFCTRRGLALPTPVVDGVIAVHTRDRDAGPSALRVLEADVACGLIEDVLWFVGPLDQPIERLPASARATLGLEGPDVASLACDLRARFDRLDDFEPIFDRAVVRRAVQLLERNAPTGASLLDRPDFAEWRHALRQGVLQAIVFPVNNEAICQGARLFTEVVRPLVDALGSEGLDAIPALQCMTDREALAAADTRGLLLRPAVAYAPRLPREETTAR